METDNKLTVAVYDSHNRAEAAVLALQKAGFDMKKISIIARDFQTEEHVIGFLNAGDRARIFGKFGALWGGLMGILFGSAFMFIPVVGHLIVLGPIAAALVSGLEGAAALGGTSALIGALTALGIPRNSVLRYETDLKANKYLLAVHGDAADIEKASALLESSGYSSIDHHLRAA